MHGKGMPEVHQLARAQRPDTRVPGRAAMPEVDKSALRWTVVLRRRPVRMVQGRPHGGYTDEFELICTDCGDHPDLDFQETSAELQRIRGPYPIAAGVKAYQDHLRCRHKQPVCAPGSAGGRTR
jgi:hypothetical protein